MDKTQINVDVDDLTRQLERYLAVVEAFRAVGCNVGGRDRPVRRKDER